MRFDNVEKEILEEIVDQVEDTLYGCGASCFEDVLEVLDDDEEFKRLVDEEVKNIAQEEMEAEEINDMSVEEYINSLSEDQLNLMKEEAKYEVLSNKVKSIITKLRKEIRN